MQYIAVPVQNKNLHVTRSIFAIFFPYTKKIQMRRILRQVRPLALKDHPRVIGISTHFPLIYKKVKYKFLTLAGIGIHENIKHLMFLHFFIVSLIF